MTLQSPETNKQEQAQGTWAQVRQLARKPVSATKAGKIEGLDARNTMWGLAGLEESLRYFIFQLAESHLTPTLFRQILGRIERLAWHPT